MTKSSNPDFEHVAGSFLILATGEYSETDSGGPFVVLRSFTRQQAVDAFEAQWKLTNAWPEDFIGWLIASGYVEDTSPDATWHIGSGAFEP